MPPLIRRALLGTALLAVIAAAIYGTRPPDDPPTPPFATDSARHDAAVDSPRSPIPPGRTGLRELATSGPSTRRSAVEFDGLAPAGFLDRHTDRVLEEGVAFLDAFLAIDAGEGQPADRRRVLATATPGLAATVLSARPRLPAAMDDWPPRAEIDAVAVEFDKPPTAAQVRAEVHRDSDRSDIAVIVQRKESRWAVTQIIE